jgi:subtilisin family serine protease
MDAESNYNAGFDRDKLSKSVIAIPLLEIMRKKPFEPIPVIIDVNHDYLGGRTEARRSLLNRIKAYVDVNVALKEEEHPQYVFVSLRAEEIRELVRLDQEISEKKYHLIYKIWPDFPVEVLLTDSVKTVKADAAKISFAATGDDIIWAVLDTGIDNTHQHFQDFKNLDTPYSKDFTVPDDQLGNPYLDDHGHGTHVAGIIAGKQDVEILAAQKRINQNDQLVSEIKKYKSISGIAPQCKLVSLKVLKSDGKGVASNTIKAIQYIQKTNDYGRDLKIHGINISIGHRFDPEWFACGQSPLCIEVNRLVKSGVVVVVAAGNTGYGFLKTDADENTPAGISLSINDPGNADLAITVGSTHRDMPHIYGVSYFSSKGPTGDGRLKPDLIAPGEKIISCATGDIKIRFKVDQPFEYCEESGTSMAAPHVSGVIAAFLSIRKEFKGQPEKIKEIFNSTATDLKRDKYFQGNGLIDLMRAIQSV